MKEFFTLKKALPYSLDVLSDLALKFNSENDRNMCGCFRCIAFAVSGSKVISYGENIWKTHTFTKAYHDKNLNTMHAEAHLVHKLIKSNKIEKVTDIVVLRGTLRLLNSRPCYMCMSVLKTYLPKVRLWWYNSDKGLWVTEIL